MNDEQRRERAMHDEKRREQFLERSRYWESIIVEAVEQAARTRHEGELISDEEAIRVAVNNLDNLDLHDLLDKPKPEETQGLLRVCALFMPEMLRPLMR
jgi:hypothetical protein